MKTSPFSSTLRKNQTGAEKLLWSKIRGRQLMGIKFRRQHSIPSYIVDFVSLENKLVIELDGGDHSKEETKVYDHNRTKFLAQKGYKVIRFWNNDILKQISEVLEAICSHIHNPHPDPLPINRAREAKE